MCKEEEDVKKLGGLDPQFWACATRSHHKLSLLLGIMHISK